MTLYSLLEASSIFSMGLYVDDLDDVPKISLLTTIFVPFRLVTIISLCSSIFSSLGWGLCFFSSSSICFFSSGVTIFSIFIDFGSFLVKGEHLYTCASHSTAQVWQLWLSHTCFCTAAVVRWSADLLPTVHWSISVSGLIYISLKQRQGQFPAKNHVLWECAPLSSSILAQCHFPSHRVWIKIWIMSLFFNQRYESVPSRHVIYLI